MMELELSLLALLTRLILSTGNNKIPLNILQEVTRGEGGEGVRGSMREVEGV